MHDRQLKQSGWIITGFFILVSIAACSSSRLTPDRTVVEDEEVYKQEATLLNTDGWKLTTLKNEQDELIPVLPQTTISLLFQDGRLAGRSGCNNYFSAYQVKGNKLSVNKPGSTMMACPEAVMMQEFNYLRLLSRAAEYQIAENQLQLIDNAGKISLIFEVDEPAQLSDGTWQLNAFNIGNGLISNLDTEQINVTFKEGKVNGFSGCNLYSTTYEINADKISFGVMKTTRKFCNNPVTIMQTEQNYFTALGRTVSFKIKANQLTFIDQFGSRVVVYNKQK